MDRDNTRFSGRVWTKLAAVTLALLFVSTLGLTAQEPTVTLTPPTIDPANRSRVAVTIEKDDHSVDTERMSRVRTISVEGIALVRLPASGGGLMFDPPALTTPGPKSVRLLDAQGAELGRASIEYSAPVAMAAPTVAPTFTEDDVRRREQARRDALSTYSWYYVLVSLMFGAVLVPFVMAIYRGISGGGFLDETRPLGLPVGSFRSILAYSLVAYVGFYVLTSILSVSQFLPPDFLLGIVATVVGFYFGSRSGEDGDKASTTAAVRGVVTQAAHAVAGATVKFKRDSDGTEPYSRLTNIDGRFELTGIAAGNYSVQASTAAGATSPAIALNLTEGADHEIALILP